MKTYTINDIRGYVGISEKALCTYFGRDNRVYRREMVINQKDFNNIMKFKGFVLSDGCWVK